MRGENGNRESSQKKIHKIFFVCVDYKMLNDRYIILFHTKIFGRASVHYITYLIVYNL